MDWGWGWGWGGRVDNVGREGKGPVEGQRRCLQFLRSGSRQYRVSLEGHGGTGNIECVPRSGFPVAPVFQVDCPTNEQHLVC